MWGDWDLERDAQLTKRYDFFRCGRRGLAVARPALLTRWLHALHPHGGQNRKHFQAEIVGADRELTHL